MKKNIWLIHRRMRLWLVLGTHCVNNRKAPVPINGPPAPLSELSASINEPGELINVPVTYVHERMHFYLHYLSAGQRQPVNL